MIKVIEFNGKGKGSRAEYITLKEFESLNDANKYIDENTDSESKYWTLYSIIEVDKKIDVEINN